MRKLIEQIMKFGVVGFVCFFIDYGLMIMLTEVVGLNYLVSSGISFTISVVVNYVLSMKFVFQTHKDSDKKKEFVIFVLLSILGLALNQILMWLCVSVFNIFYMISKIGVTAIVMVYNFITRKMILENKIL